MILAVDVGNTNIEIGCCLDDKIIFVERISTDIRRTPLEYAVLLKEILNLHGICPDEIDGAIAASVVPSVTDNICEAVKKATGCNAVTVGPGVRTGLSIVIDNPAQLGADLAAGAVAATEYYGYPIVIFDMGTAVTASVIDEKRNFIGGIIMPGIGTSLGALAVNASQLQSVALEMPRSLIGKNTVDCMKSGLIFGTAAEIDGIIDRIEEEMGYGLKAVATGENARMIISQCRHKITVDDKLLIKGLALIYKKNRQ
ncbi:MAG: type III pantothenate kinase [Porcipelethomonas sp.]